MASFRNVYTSLLLVIAGSTDKELARQVNYLKAENQILRSRLPGRISLTEREKNRLIRFAKNLGSALNELATIVHPGTIRRWIREAAAKSKARRKGKSGRPRTAMDIEKLILKLAKDNSWGYTRILGELKKLGIESVTRNTVKNILKRNGFESGPIESTKAGGPKCKILMLDNDAKYSKLFMDVFEKGKIKTQRTPIRSPNMVAFAERFVQTIKQECLDHFVVFGHKHMDLLCQEFKDYYHEERPHQGLENELVIDTTRTKKRTKSGTKPSETVSIPISEIRCKERLGGLLKSYSRRAA
ncbi:integrase core domain-containing protein [Pirellulaceae bacterium SH501]